MENCSRIPVQGCEVTRCVNAQLFLFMLHNIPHESMRQFLHLSPILLKLNCMIDIQMVDTQLLDLNM